MSKKDEKNEKNYPDSSEDVVELEFEDEGSTTKDKVAKLKSQIKTLQAEKQEYLDGWQRSRAEYANLKKSGESDKGKIIEILKTDLLENFLPVLDSFNMAFSNKKTWEAVDQNWRVGVEHIYNQLKSVMEEYGLEEIGKEGEDFNEEVHESVETEDTENESDDHKVSKVVQKGYRRGEYIIRPAKVKVYSFKK